MADNRKIENVFKKERGKLLNFIRKSVLSKEDAEDILHDVFSRLIESFPELETLDSITSWLFTTTRNRITDMYRKKSPELFSDVETFKHDGEELLNLADILPDTKTLPDRELIIDALWEETERALGELPAEQREVFVLNEFEDYTYKEISLMLNVPVNTLLSRKRYAVLHLRTRLQNFYEEIKNEY